MIYLSVRTSLRLNVLVLQKHLPGSDNLARFGGLESLVNGMADEVWDGKDMNRISSIHFMDEGEEDDDDEKVRLINTY